MISLKHQPHCHQNILSTFNIGGLQCLTRMKALMLTPLRPSNKPTASKAPVMTCVVDTGSPTRNIFSHSCICESTQSLSSYASMI